MRVPIAITLTISGLLGLPPILNGQAKQTPQEKAIAQIKKLGGKIEVDTKRPQRPVVGIDLEKSKVNDDDLALLQFFPNLQSLNLAKTSVSEAGLVNIKDLTKLRSLNLNDTQVIGQGLANLGGLRNLEVLELKNDRITGRELIYIKDLPLQTLNLEGTPLTNLGLTHIKGMTSLKNLNLRGTRVTNNGILHLRELSKLEKLDLRDLSIADGVYEELRQLFPKAKIIR